MDQTKAEEWEKKLRGQTIEQWTIGDLIDHGKSAAVFRAVGPDGPVAIKIFDDEIIARHGDKSQLARIELELTLVGKHHPNLVKLVGGGVHGPSGNHYIVMEFLNGPSLAKCLASVPETNIPHLVGQLVSACEFLESLGLAHRDVKPANIVILEDFNRLVLLDFGVLKPVGERGFTDVDGQRLFVGTLQYSSPEFLLRDEDNTVEGWRSLTLYQVGAVLHDLIMRRPIFDEFVNPYAALVNAVQHELPGVASETAPSYLVDACRMALVKDPKKRLELVSWNSFRPPIAASIAEQARKRVGQRILLAQAETTPDIDNDAAATRELLDNVIEGLKVEFRRIRQANASLIPPLGVTRDGKGAPRLIVRMRPSDTLKLSTGLVMTFVVEIIDVDSQAISVRAAAATKDDAIASAATSEVFRGPYSSGTLGDRIEATVFVALDRAQQGGDSAIALDGSGGE